MAQSDRLTGSVVDIAFGSSLTPAAPTVAEINALDRLECYVVGSGFSTPRSGSTIDISSLCERDDYNVAGPITNGPIVATLWREFDGTDTAWAALDDTADPPTTDYLVVCRGGFTGVAGIADADDNVDVYTVQIVSREPSAPNKGEAQRFDAQWAVANHAFDVAVIA
jgi:hypothetical protein